ILLFMGINLLNRDNGTGVALRLRIQQILARRPKATRSWTVVATLNSNDRRETTPPATSPSRPACRWAGSTRLTAVPSKPLQGFHQCPNGEDKITSHWQGWPVLIGPYETKVLRGRPLHCKKSRLFQGVEMVAPR